MIILSMLFEIYFVTYKCFYIRIIYFLLNKLLYYKWFIGGLKIIKDNLFSGLYSYSMVFSMTFCKNNKKQFGGI